MAYVAPNYKSHPKAPLGSWACAPTSSLQPQTTAPTGSVSKGLDLCGQCVSYVKQVCPTLPNTKDWVRGTRVRDVDGLLPGTVIATFNAEGKYQGHAAIFESKNTQGLLVYDQWMTPPTPSPVGSRLLRWGAPKASNNGDAFHVVE
jgi:hypothetical protein